MRKAIYKRIFAFSLTAALALTSVFTGSVPASAKKAPKLSKKKLTVTVGKTAKLKVKNATKTVKWSTSNKKVAKITKKSGKKKVTATIKGVKKGSAKITAKVGSKKLTCKVTVKKAATNVKSIAVDQLDSSCLVVTLKKKAAINLSDIKLLTKEFNAGKYNDQAKVKAITSADQTVYRLYTDENIVPGRYVKLTIKKDVYEAQNKPTFMADTSMDQEDLTLLAEKDQLMRESCGAYFVNAVGDCSYKVTDGALPAGTTLDSKAGIIKGIPTTVGSSSVTIQATDEMSRKAKVTLTFNVYDEKTIAGWPLVREVRLDNYTDKRIADPANNEAGKDFYQSFTISPVGGSESYKFSFAANDVAGAELSTTVKSADGQVTDQEASSTRLRIPFSIAEGTHTITIHVVDAKDANIAADIPVTLNVVRYFDVNGTVTEEGGKQVTKDRIFFIPKDSVYRSQYTRGIYSVKNADISKMSSDEQKLEYEYRDKYLGGTSYNETNSNYTVRTYSGCTTRAGDSSVLTTPGRAIGTYATELAAGEYIVKIYSAADDIFYETTSHVTVGAADAPGQNLVLPTRLYSVNGTATYANGTPLAKETIYFETLDNQYAADQGFSVETSDTGSFIASLPTGTYAAYVRDDETDKRLYFTSNIEVKGADTVLSAFALAVSKTTVSGTVTVDGTPLREGNNFYLFTKDVNDTDKDSKAKYVEIQDDKGTFSVLLTPGTYYPKYYSNGAYRNMTPYPLVVGEQAMPNTALTYSVLSELGTPTVVPVTPATASAVTAVDVNITSEGTYLQVTAAKSGSYTLNVTSTDANLSYVDYRASSVDQFKKGNYNDSGTINNGSRTVYLSQGDNYIRLIPYGTERVYDSDGDYYNRNVKLPSAAVKVYVKENGSSLIFDD